MCCVPAGAFAIYRVTGGVVKRKGGGMGCAVCFRGTVSEFFIGCYL